MNEAHSPGSEAHSPRNEAHSPGNEAQASRDEARAAGNESSVHHAEYKIPGGKLLVVDLQLRQGRLHRVQLSGDFFLEPPETLTTIDAALEGLPYDAPDSQIEAAVRAVLDADVMMFGITVEGIAVVIRRALS